MKWPSKRAEPVTQQEKEDETLAKARKRVGSMGTHELLNWADQAGSGMARALQDYRRHKDETSLLEAMEGLTGLKAVIEELHIRHEY